MIHCKLEDVYLAIANHKEGHWKSAGSGQPFHLTGHTRQSSRQGVGQHSCNSLANLKIRCKLEDVGFTIVDHNGGHWECIGPVDVHQPGPAISRLGDVGV